MAYLTIRKKGEDGHSRKELDKDRLILGRASESDLPVTSDQVSRQHCAIIREGELWYVEDLGSSNGTLVNKKKITGRVMLRERDVIKAGPARLTFHDGNGRAVIALPESALDTSRGPVATRVTKPEDPPEAMPCAGCGAWYSIAHRLPGDTIECPRCGKANPVPQLVSEATP